MQRRSTFLCFEVSECALTIVYFFSRVALLPSFHASTSKFIRIKALVFTRVPLSVVFRHTFRFQNQSLVKCYITLWISSPVRWKMRSFDTLRRAHGTKYWLVSGNRPTFAVITPSRMFISAASGWLKVFELKIMKYII